MKKLLFTTLPSNDLGLLTRSLPIARELAERGAPVTFCSSAPAPRHVIADGGFENHTPNDPFLKLVSSEINPKNLMMLLAAKDRWRSLRTLFRFGQTQLKYSTDEIWTIDHFMAFFGMLDPDFIEILVSGYTQVIRDTGAEAVIDFWNPFACIAARLLNLPLITIIQSDMHPLSRGFIWWKAHPPELPSPRQATNSALHSFGLPAVQQTGELLLGDKTLVVGIPELDPLPKTAEVTYIGPVLWQKSDAKLPDQVQQLKNDRPIIWLYPGNLQYFPGYKTAFDSKIVLDACIQALADLNVQVVLTTGHHQLPSAYKTLPNNFLRFPFVPGLAMAEKSTLMIHHGGYGSCQTGLYTGTPALVIPTYSERESNARRIAQVQAGDFVLPVTSKKGARKEIDSRTVREKALKILADASYSENAKHIQQKLHTAGGAPQAAQIIADHLNLN